jgi:CarD family transcriptional regulator
MTKTKKKNPAKKPAAKAKSKAAPKKVSRPLVKAKAAHKPAAKPAHKPVVKRAATARKPHASAQKPVLKPAAEKLVHVAKPQPAPQAKLVQPELRVQVPPPVGRPVMTGPVVIVYPAHGVGRVTQIEEQEIAGARLELYIVDFEKEKLRLKVPTGRAEQKGMRRLSDRGQIEQALRVLKGRARIKRTMWSRRAQEYDAKINSGDLIAVAEVVRDLYRSERQPEQSYSERQLFEQALERMAREIAAVKKIDDDQSIKEVEDYLAKNAKRTPAPGDKAEDDVPSEEAA